MFWLIASAYRRGATDEWDCGIHNKVTRLETRTADINTVFSCWKDGRGHLLTPDSSAVRTHGGVLLRSLWRYLIETSSHMTFERVPKSKWNYGNTFSTSF